MFVKNYCYFVFLFLVLLTCSKEKEAALFNKTKTALITKFHQQIDSLSSDSTYISLQKANKLIKSISPISDSLKAENNYLLGLYFREQGNLDSASFYFYNATEYVQDSICNDKQRYYFYEAWYAFKGQDKFGDCLVLSRRFKSLIDKKNYENLAWFYFFDENIYKRLKNYPKALENNELRIKMLKLANNSVDLVQAYISQAGLKYNFLGEKEASLAIFKKLINDERKLNLSNDQKRQLYENYGIFLYYEGAYKRSLSNYLIALDNTNKMINTDKISLLANLYANIAEVNIDLKQYEQANAYLDSIKALGINNIDNRLQRSTLNYQLRLAALTNKNTNEVIRYLDTIFHHQDEVYSNKYNREILALSKANQKEKILLEEKQATKIKALKTKSRLTFLLTFLVVMMFLGLLYYRQRKYKFEKQSLQMQQRLLRSQMNPHFISNTLYAIQNLIKKDPVKSTKYLLKFSRLLRLILDNSMSNYVQLEDEIDSLNKYLDLQLLRFPEKFNYEIIIKNMEEGELLFIPPMLIQPFVENSIEHGFSSINYEGKIIITLSLKDQFIQCNIKDNGAGFSKPNSQIKNAVSTGLISDFIEKMTHSKIEITENNLGVSVNFLIPYKLSDND